MRSGERFYEYQFANASQTFARNHCRYVSQCSGYGSVANFSGDQMNESWLYPAVIGTELRKPPVREPGRT